MILTIVPLIFPFILLVNYLLTTQIDWDDEHENDTQSDNLDNIKNNTHNSNKKTLRGEFTLWKTW